MLNSSNTNEIIKRIHSGGFAFSLISLFSSIFILLLMFFNKILRSLTYNFLICVFISEFLGNIGKILEYEKDNGELLLNKLSLILIPFSDINIMILFCFFSKCSNELIKKSNRNIKEKEKKYFFISFIISIIYTIIINIFLQKYDDDPTVRFYFYENSDLNYLRFIHIGFLAILTCYISYNIIPVIKSMKEKQKSDRINAWKIAKLIKVLFRFPLICFFYWILYIPSLLLTYYDDRKKKLYYLYFYVIFCFIILFKRISFIFKYNSDK